MTKGFKDSNGKFRPTEKKNGVNSNLHKLEIPESQKDNPIWIEMQQRLAREEKVKCEQCNKEVTKNDLTRHGIYVYTPTGVELAYIPTPKVPTNVGFGREQEGNTLYITAESDLYRIKVKKKGYQLPFR